MPRPVPRVESFGPGIMAALLEGAKTGLSLDLPYRKAVQFRQRLYQLRAAMRAEGHSEYKLVSRVRVTITWDPATNTVVSSKNVPIPRDRQTLVRVDVAPLDSEFDDALLRAGINTRGGRSSSSGQDLDQFLKDLEKGT